MRFRKIVEVNCTSILDPMLNKYQEVEKECGVVTA